ncbi:MAG TPA: TA system VapC family ribonuclease toxin, partial [Candidatus Binatia bacterium]|nr:TA system VapC family ribonuclease toxin [Candidatus Binatia bacterium]
IAVDTNVLVFAHREEFPEHPIALERLRALAEGDEAWGLPVFVVGEFLRVVTHPRILRPPSPMEAALDALRGLLESPSLRLLRPGERYWSLLDEAIRDARASGNLVVDAEIVAVCREHGATTILTEDRDFRRFRGVTAVPLGGGSPGRSGTR